jgi:hypothetical protein
MQHWLFNHDLWRVKEHALDINAGMCQYLFAHSPWVYQGHQDQRPMTQKAWRLLAQVRPGDKFVPWLPKDRMPERVKRPHVFAVGTVRPPRKPPDHIESALTNANGGQTYWEGVIHYHDAPAYYQDWTTSFYIYARAAGSKHAVRDDEKHLYPQRADVEEWLYVCRQGVPLEDRHLRMTPERVPTHLIHDVLIPISEDYYNGIRYLLGARAVVRMS